MKKNVGGIDRFFRFGVGFVCLALVFANDHPVWKLVFGIVAVIGLLTAATGYCPVSDLLKFNTAEKK
jgi:Inner membrane protein YgaP-like, transmembrane domain